MKRVILCLTFCLFINENQAQTIIWEDEIVVGNATDHGVSRPRMALGKDNEPLIIMTRIQNGQIYFTKELGGVFTTPSPLLLGSLQSYIANWTGPDMEAHGDTVVVVFKAKPYDNGHVYSIRSTDGGLTFSDTIRVDNHDTGIAWMPSMDMDQNGNPIVTYMAHDANYTNPRYVYVNSTDAGITYQNEQVITSNIPGEACDCCPAELVSKDSKQILLYRNNELNVRDIHGVYSNNSGASFDSADDVDASNWVINSCPASGPHGTILDSVLYTTFMSGVGGSEKIYVSKSILNDSLTFQEKQLVSPTATVAQNYQRIASFNDLVLVAWTESVSNNYDIYTAYAFNGDLLQMTTTHQQANSTVNGIQTNPDIRIENGNIHLVYQDIGNGQVIYRKGKLGFTGLEENQAETELLYPNPISVGQLLHLPSVFMNSTVEWYDVTGKVVHVSTHENQLTYLLPKLELGSYFLKAQNQNTLYRVYIYKN